MARRYYSSTAVDTTLTASTTNVATSITVASTSGFPSVPFTAIIDKDTASEEVVTVTNVAGLALTVTRGVDGTSGVAHDSGAAFQHGVSARDFDEPNDHINATSGVHSHLATLASPTFTGTVTLPSTTSIGSVSDTEIGYVNGVTSAIQTQLDAKAPTASPTFSGTVTIGSYAATGAWTSFTPTLGGSGWAAGSGASLTGEYKRIGNIVHFRINLTFGTGMTAGSNSPTFALPFTADWDVWTANAVCYDSSTGFYYEIPALGGTTTISPRRGATSYGGISSTVPFTWASSDRIVINGTYEAA